MPGTKWREMFMQRNLSHKRVADADAGGLAGRGGGGGDTTKQRSNNDVVGVFDHAVEQRGALSSDSTQAPPAALDRCGVWNGAVVLVVYLWNVGG